MSINNYTNNIKYFAINIVMYHKNSDQSSIKDDEINRKIINKSLNKIR